MHFAFTLFVLSLSLLLFFISFRHSSLTVRAPPLTAPTTALATLVIIVTTLLTTTIAHTQNLECVEIKRDDSYDSNVCTFVNLQIDDSTEVRIVRTHVKPWYLIWKKDFELNQITKINIRDSKVNLIPRIIFQQYKNVQEVSVTKTGLRNWHPLTFVHAKYLHSLNLAGNEVKNLPQIAFFGANVLNTVDLSNNLISTVDPFAFINLQNLRRLRLDGNRLLTLDLRLFSTEKIQSLNVSGNALKKFHMTADTVATLTRPTELKILATNNKIDDFHIQADFPVSELKLGSNQLNAMNTVMNFNALAALDLNSNPLGNLPLTMFFNVGQLQYLNVRNTALVSINPTLFSRLTKLKHLDLSFNNFTTIDWNSFASLMNLEELVIFDYAFKVEDVEHLAVILPSLKSIWISKQDWECDDQEQVVEFFKKKEIAVNEVGTKFGGVEFPSGNLCLRTLYL